MKTHFRTHQGNVACNRKLKNVKVSENWFDLEHNGCENCKKTDQYLMAKQDSPKEELSACGKTLEQFLEECNDDCSNVEYKQANDIWAVSTASDDTILRRNINHYGLHNYRIKEPKQEQVMDTVKVEVELRKCWVRDSCDDEWRPRWNMVGTNFAIMGHDHSKIPANTNYREPWDEITFEDPTKPKVKQGKELIGCLCGVGITSLAEAEEEAKKGCLICVIINFTDTYGIYEDNRGFHWKYAYPVPAEKIQELLDNAKKGV